MGIVTVLQSSDGEHLQVVEDPKNLIHSCFPHPNADTLDWLSKIDWYGDTTFNYLQAANLVRELDDLRSRCHHEEALNLIERIRDLALRLSTERHTYLVFYGD